MDKEIAERIAHEVYENIWDLNLNQLKDLHVAFILNVFFSMQEVTEQNILDEFLIKHKKLSEKIIDLELRK